MGEKRGKHTLPTTRLASRPSSPTAHSGLHSLHRTIIGQKDHDSSISNPLDKQPEGREDLKERIQEVDQKIGI